MTHAKRKSSYSRAHRLGGPRAFAAVLAYRCWVASDMFQVFAKSNSGGARLGLVIAKQAVRHAVARNYAKRLAREVFRAERAALEGVDLVVRVRRPIGRAAAASARAEIRELMRRAQELCRRRSMLSGANRD